MGLNRSGLATLILVVVAGSAWLLVSRVELSTYQDPEVWNLNNARGLALACQVFAGENSGSYPPCPDALVPGTCSAEGFARIRNYRDGKSGRLYDYHYFPGLAVGGDSNLPLIAAPGPIDGNRIVVRVDVGQGRFAEEAYLEMKRRYLARQQGRAERPAADGPEGRRE